MSIQISLGQIGRHSPESTSIASFRQENGLSPEAVVPADAVTASASGLDPRISIQNARLQILRVAKERGLTEAVASAEVDKATERPFLGIGGDPGFRII